MPTNPRSKKPAAAPASQPTPQASPANSAPLIPQIPPPAPMSAQIPPKPVAQKVDSLVQNMRNRPKPIIEGINSPVPGQVPAPVVAVKPIPEPVMLQPQIQSAQSDLTPEESELISETDNDNYDDGEPKLLSRSAVVGASKRRHRVKGPIMTGLILLVLVAAAYEVYIWQLNQNAANVAPLAHHMDIASGQNPDGSGSLMSSSSTSSLVNLPIFASSTTPSSTVAQGSTTPAALPQLKITSTPTGYLNVRDIPSTSGNIIAKVHPGETYPYSSTQNGWYQIQMVSGQIGWVSGQYVQTQ